MFNFKGVLFDLDGTLVDSTPAVERSWGLWCENNGISFAELSKVFHGKPAQDTIREFLADSSEEKIKEEINWLKNREAEDTDGVDALPGVLHFIETLDAHAIPWAIVTSGAVPVATARIKASGLPTPEVLVTPERVSKGKPDPEPFLLGAELIGIDPSDCLVFEDSPAGLVAGKKAGCTTIGITTTFDKSKLTDADVCIRSMADISLNTNEGIQLSIDTPA